MKILSFNVHNKNRKLDDLVSFLAKENPDIVCLQEFPTYKLEKLAHLSGYHIHTAKETLVLKYTKRENRHFLLVILSRYPIEEAGIIEHLAHGRISLRHKLGLEKRLVPFQFIDVTDPEGKAFRIFNCHLECAVSPSERLTQFKDIVRYRARERENIICGDFNTFSSSITAPFVFWLFGYKFRHLFTHERKMFQQFFTDSGLQNPLFGKTTFRYLPVQLDYILLPEAIPVRSAKVMERFYGSDHRPLIVEV